MRTPQEAEPPLRVPDGFIDAPADVTALTVTRDLPFAPGALVPPT
ncbi:hypothetical protein [Streptomyces sp. NPDC017556]